MREPGHTRERLLKTALELFTRQGYEATSLQQLADQLKVSKAAIYYYFPSKRDILRALVEPMTAELEARLDQVESCGLGVGDADRGGLASYIDFLISQRSVLTFMHQDSSWLADMTELHARHRAAQARVAAILLGKSRDIDGLVRFTVAMAGSQAAVALHPEVDPIDLRAALIACITPVLEAVPGPGARDNPDKKVHSTSPGDPRPPNPTAHPGS